MRYLNGEEFKDVVGYEGYYQVSNMGRIFSTISNRFLSKGLSHCGYEIVVLCVKQRKKSMLVHRLVAESFLGIPDTKLDVNHVDGVKTNNCLSNLEWSTRSNNIKHAHLMGLSKCNLPPVKSGIENHNCKSVTRISPNGEVKEFHSIQDALISTGFRCASNISNALNGRSKSAYGFIWQYSN